MRYFDESGMQTSRPGYADLHRENSRSPHLGSTIGFGLIALAALAISIWGGCAPANGPADAPSTSDGRLLVVGVARDHPPYSFVDIRGEPCGISIDLIEAVGAVMGLTLELRPGTTAELRAALETGRVDILPDVPLSQKLEERFALSLPHSDVNDGIFVRTDTESLPEDGNSGLLRWLQGRTVVTLEDDPSLEVLDGDPGPERILTEDSAADALRHLSAGDGDVAILPARTGLLMIDQLELSNLQILPFDVGAYSRGLSFAVRSDDRDLLAQLDEGLVIVTSTRRYVEIHNRWQQYRGDESGVAKIVLSVLVPALALLVASALWTLALRRTVASRTRQLEEEMSERRQLEEQIQHARKLESLGVLAGGIAHDFNNLLVGVLGNVGLAKTQMQMALAETEQLDTGIREKLNLRLDEIEKAGRRAADLTRQMLAYSGKGGFVARPVDLSALIRQNQSLLHSTVPDGIEIQTELAQDLPRIEADPAQLSQILVQLVTNAAEALEVQTPGAGEEEGQDENLTKSGKNGDGSGAWVKTNDNGHSTARPATKPGGRILLRTGIRYCDRDELEKIYLGEPMEAGNYTFLEVHDNGSGMSPAVRERIFEPFFTTKFTGRGLGLAAALGIVRGHGGAITVDTSKGKGSRFCVYFPAAEEILTPIPEPVLGPTMQRQDTGAVLVVDDEEIVRRVVTATLEGAGYDVLEAVDGEQAVEVFKQNPEVRVVILDATMPRLGGFEAYERLRRLRPEVRVVFTSGYDQEQAISRLSGAQLSSFLPKPYRQVELLEAVHNAAAGGTAPHRSSPPHLLDRQ